MHIPIKPVSNSDFKIARYSGRKAVAGFTQKLAIDSDTIAPVVTDGFCEWRIDANYPLQSIVPSASMAAI
ncbi:hypothetical protein [Methylomonas sp. UP202]|uniref:hypothetical protein n=1 Tax=Methylomonas sp. UP202 TaxID=3040943 RepID=UPI002478B012|nr:hypothetical protein [Methylomonas sp. UP202]WGS87725.1 hypothetical protein QC632_08185 [Methylomonas sp. UP202]